MIAAPAEAIIRLVLSVVVVIVWSHNLMMSYCEWKTVPDRRSLRLFLKSAIIEMVTITLVLAALTATTMPSLVDVTRLFIGMTTISILVVGIWTAVLWHPARAERITHWWRSRK